MPDAAYRLAPAEVFLDALADRLARPVAIVSRRAPVNGAAAASAIVLRHVGCDIVRSADRDEVGSVVSLVGADERKLFWLAQA